MKAWFRWNRRSTNPNLGYAKMADVDLTREPCPTVQAMGLGGSIMGSTSSRPLLVGEASNIPGGEPFGGRSGAVLAAMAGLTFDEFRRRFDRVNLLRRWPGREPGQAKGHKFPLAAARHAAARLDVRGRRVVLAGRRVALAFGLRGFEFLAGPGPW